MLKRSVGGRPYLCSSHDSSGIAEGENREERLTSLLKELLEILNMEIGQYQDLLSLLYDQREQFASFDVKAFEDNSKQQGTLVLKIKTLEEARKSIIRSLAQHFYIPAKGFTLTKLAELVDEPYNELCMEYQREVLLLIKNLESIRESNAYLVQHALHHVSGVLKIFASAHATDLSYSGAGKIKQEKSKGRYVSGWG